MFARLIRAFGPSAKQRHRPAPARKPRQARLEIESLEERLVPATDLTSIPYVAHAGPTMLGLNFDGENFYNNGNTSVNAYYHTSSGQTDQDIQDLLFRVSEVYAPFGVEVTRLNGFGTYYNSNGDTTVFVGQSNGSNKIGLGQTPDEYTDYPTQNDVIGWQNGDGNNLPLRDSEPYHLTFVDPSANYNKAAQAIAHESAHTFGLAHVRTDNQFDPASLGSSLIPDIMAYTSNPSLAYFADQSMTLTAANYDANSGQTNFDYGNLPDYPNDLPATQNDYQALTQVLGAASPGGFPYHVADIAAIDYHHQSQFVHPGTDDFVGGDSIIVQNGSIMHLGQYDVYRWTAPVTETLTSVTVTGTNGLNPVVMMYQNNGSLKWTNGGSAPANSSDTISSDKANTLLYSYDSRSGAVGSLSVTAGTSYFFVVGAQDSDSTGNYTLTINQLPPWAKYADGKLTITAMGVPISMNNNGSITWGGENLTFDQDPQGRTLVTLTGSLYSTGQTVQFEQGQLFNGIVANVVSNGPNHVNILATNAYVTLNVNDAANDIVTLGKNSSLAGLNGTIAVGGGKSLLIDGSADAGYDDFTITSNWYNQHYVNWGNTYVFYDTMGSVTVNAGTGGSYFDVESTGAALTLNTGTASNQKVVVGGASNPVSIVVQDQTTNGIDVVNIGGNGSLTSITAPVTVSQSSNSHSKIAMNIDDADEGAAETIKITSGQVAFSGLPNATVNFQGVNFYSLMIEDPWYENNTIDFESRPTGINEVTIYTKDTHDSRIGPYWNDIGLMYPPNWGSVIPLPQGLQLFTPGQQVQGL
jgi:hypothetical protein